MKRFIIKTSFFVAPFLLLYFINLSLYDKREGDLSRLGYIYHNQSPYSNIMKEAEEKVGGSLKFSVVSALNFDKENAVDVLTIGDSFSDQAEYGYQNFLAKKGGLSVLHYDGFLSEYRPFQTLVQLINSDFFDKVKPKYIVLESVQRSAIERGEGVNLSEKKNIKSIKEQIEKHKIKKEAEKEEAPAMEKLKFFSDATVKIPLINFQYLFLNRPFKSDVYRFKSNNQTLFSNNPDDLLFYKDDLKVLDEKNSPEKIKNLNDVFNKINEKLAKRGIKFIVLIAPDKYDLYYPYIKDKPSGKQSHFFDEIGKLPKNYIFIPSYKVLSDEIKKEKDIYFYDDTHWSYKGANIIAGEISNIINNKTE